MKFTTTAVLSTSALLATTSAAPSPGTTYQLRVHDNTNSALDNTIVTLKDESATTNLTALGVFSTGNVRHPYTFTLSGSGDTYEAKGTKKQTHLVLTGNPIAMGLYDVPIGADPQPGPNEKQVKTFQTSEGKGFSYDLFEPTKPGSGSWRACKGDSTIDYTLYFFDGLSALDKIVKGCELVWLSAEKVDATSPSSTITGVPAPTATNPSGFITGVPAPTASGNATATGAKPSPSSFQGAASRLGMAGTAMTVVLGAMAFLL